jgi:acid stress-induced BolA-like protein IbaG/YrbA
MAQLRQKIIRVLRGQLADLQDALEDLPGGRVSGVIVSSAFKSMDHQARQEKLNAILKRRLTADELSAVGAIAALTPAEATVKAI